MARKSVSAYPMSIDFNADTTNFDKSVSQINKELRSLKGELAAVNKILLVDPKNVEMQKAKLEILNRQVEKNKAKQDMYAEAIRTGASGMAVYADKITEAKANLKKYTEQGTKTKGKLKEFDEAIKENTRKFEECEEQVRNAKIRYEETGLAIAKANAEIRRMNGKDIAYNLEVVGKGLQSVSKGFGAAAQATKLISAISSASLVGATKAATDFEKQWVAVKKVLKEGDDFDKVQNQILEMGRTIPVSLDAISQAFADAAQLGVSSDNLESFVETILRLDTATNIDSGEAAIQLAQLFNVMGSDIQTVDKFASAIVHLGNNTATTERDILNMATTIAASAKSVKFSDKQILGLAAAMSSLGIEASSGGSSISKILSNIDKGLSNSKNSMWAYTNLLGVTKKTLQSMWNKDAAGTFIKIIGAIKKATNEGQNLNVILGRLGISGIKQDRTIKGLVNAYDLLKESMSLANEGYEDGNYAIKESEDAWDTLSSRLQILKNDLFELGVTFGNIIIPYVKEIVDGARNLLEAFINLDEPIKQMIIKSAAIAAVISPLFATLSKITGLLAAVALLIKSSLAPAVLEFLTTVGNVVAVIGLLATAIAYTYSKSEEFRETITEIGKTLYGLFKNIISWIFDKVKFFFDMANETWLPVLVELITNVTHIISNIIGIIKELYLIFKPVFDLVVDLLSILANLGMSVIVGLLNTVSGILDTITKKIRDAITWFRKLLGIKEDASKENFDNLTVQQTKVIPNMIMSTGGLGINTRGLNGLIQSNGVGVLNLSTSINVTNNGNPINENEIRRWGDTITDIVSVNLGRRL